MLRDVGRPQRNEEKSSTVTLQPLAADHVTIPYMMAIDIPFHMRYGSLICYKKLLNDRLKCSILCSTGFARASASLAVTWLFLIFGQAIIPHLKEENEGYLLI